MRRLVLLIFLIASVPAVASDYSSLMSRAEAAMSAKDYKTAALALEEAVALRPTDPAANLALAKAYSHQKRYRLAMTYFEEVLSLSPGHAGALIELGAVESELGMFEQAVRHFRQADDAQPNTRAKRGIAVAKARQGQLDEALAELRDLARNDPSDLESRYQIGIIFMRQGDCVSASEQFRYVTRRHPQHVGALFNLGNCLNRTGRTEEAAAVLEKFRQAAAGDELRTDKRRRTLMLLQEADSLLRKQDIDGALRVINEAISVNPDDPKPHAFRGQCLNAKGDIAGALAAFETAAALDPLDPVILVETGRLLGMSGRFQDAIPYLQKAAGIDPKMPEPHMFLAAAYQELGMTSQAAQEQATYELLSETAPR